MLQPTLLSNIASKIPGPIYRYLAKRWIDYEFPRHIFIETTQKCNLSCSTCPRPRESNDISWELFTSIIDECKRRGPRSISLHLFGEPLMWRDIIKGIRYIKSSDKRNSILLTTNGTLLNQYAKELSVGVDQIIWTWRKANLNCESRMLLKRKGLIRFLKDNNETPEGEAEWWKAQGYKTQVKEVHNYGGSISSNMELPVRYPCYHLWLAPGIDSYGNLHACCNDPNGDLCIGNVMEYGIETLWRYSKKLRQMREEHLRGEYRSICQRCNAWATYPSIF